MEYALGSRPDQATSLPMVIPGTMIVDGEDIFYVKVRQRLGAAGGLIYLPESSESEREWIDGSKEWTLSERINPYDGTGTEIVTYTLSSSMDSPALFRMKVRFP